MSNTVTVTIETRITPVGRFLLWTPVQRAYAWYVEKRGGHYDAALESYKRCVCRFVQTRIAGGEWKRLA